MGLIDLRNETLNVCIEQALRGVYHKNDHYQFTDSDAGSICWHKTYLFIKGKVPLPEKNRNSFLTKQAKYVSKQSIKILLRQKVNIDIQCVEYETPLISGKCDGIITGLLEAPVTPHVWHHIFCDPKKMKRLQKLLDEKDEKQALREWDYNAYLKAQLSMHFLEKKRHFMTISTYYPSEIESIRTEYSKFDAINAIDNITAIAESDNPPIGATGYWCNSCPARTACEYYKK